MALNRPLLAVSGGALLIILASLGGLAYLQLRTGPVAQRLIREATELERTTYPRPAHVPSPRPGTFADALKPHLDALMRAYEAQPRLVGTLAQQCREVTDGKVAPEALPPECRQVLERDRELVRQLLAATHVREGGLPEGLDLLSEPSHPSQRHGLLVVLHVVRLAALETRLLLAEGQVEAAVDTCLDTLALSRDVSLGGGLVGRMVSATGYDMAWKPCAAALDAASPARKRQAAAQLARLREGLPSFALTLRQEAVYLQLNYHAHLLLSGEERAALSPRAARLSAAGPVPGSFIPQGAALAMRLDWRATVGTFDALVDAADLPALARRDAFDAIATREREALWPPRWVRSHLYGMNVEPSGYQRYAERVERQRLQSDALVALAELDAWRAEQGRWPAALLAVTANDFTLETPTPSEARLTARDILFPELVLGFSADAPAAVPVEPTPTAHRP
jgi:hypothetical protein